MNRWRGQRGQALVIAALLNTVLIGFVGLVIDGGEAANEQQIVRGAADGAALAGVYAISTGSATAAATTLAQQVMVAVPLPVADLTMSYLDAGGSPTGVAANVVTVRAVVTDSHRTFFLGALGIPNVQLTATAEAKNQAGSSGVPAACAACLMVTSGNGLNQAGGTITITGGALQVNADLNQPGGSLSGPTSISVVGQVQQSGSISPNPGGGSVIADPLAAIAVPVVAGAATTPVIPAGASSLNPGVYATITVNAGSTLTLNSGTYVITTRLNVNGGTVNGSGVTLFLGCAAYPTACAVGASGGFISAATGSLTLSPPTSGSYFGLTVFADRNNKAGSIFGTSAVNVTGTWYTLNAAVTVNGTTGSKQFGQLVIASLTTPNGGTFTATRSATGSYGTGSGGGSLGLTL